MRVLPRSLVDPGVEPVTLAQLRDHAIVEAGVDEMLLRSFLISARTLIEQWMGRPIIERTVTAVFEDWPAFTGWRSAATVELMMPVSAVTAINYTAVGGATVAWTDFIARKSQGGVTHVRPKDSTGWPALGADPVITLTATAGFDVVPEPIATAILKLAAYLYADRDGMGDRTLGVGQIPRDILELVRPWRWIWIG